MLIWTLRSVLGGLRKPAYEAPDGLAEDAGVAASSFSFTAALRAFIFICVIFGSPNTERPSAQKPCAIKWRTRSWRFMTFRSELVALFGDRNEEWMDMAYSTFTKQSW